MLYTLLTHDCRAHYDSIITKGNELAYREEVDRLELWCKENNLILNTNKTKEMIVDFRKKGTAPPPLLIDCAAVERVSSIRYLGVHISNTLTWRQNTLTNLKKAHQRLYFLRKLKKAKLDTNILSSFYRCVVESTLSSCITVWYGSCTVAEKEMLHIVVRSAQRTIGCNLLGLTDIYTSQCRDRD